MKDNVRNEDTTYVSCREHTTERINAMQVLPSQKGRLHQSCLNKELHQQILWGKMCLVIVFIKKICFLSLIFAITVRLISIKCVILG